MIPRSGSLILVVAASALVASAQVSAAQELPVFAASLDTDLPEEEYEYIGCMCALWCAVGWSVEASSFLEPQSGNCYEVDMLNDSDIATAWVEGVEGDGVGERIDFIIEDYEPVPGESEPIEYPWRGVMVLNGYRKSQDAWESNGRVRTALVSVNHEPLCTIELEDSMLLQHVQVPETLVGHGDVISFEILEVYPGSLYEDTAVTEVILTGAH